jgi:hypothetical protein
MVGIRRGIDAFRVTRQVTRRATTLATGASLAGATSRVTRAAMETRRLQVEAGTTALHRRAGARGGAAPLIAHLLRATRRVASPAVGRIRLEIEAPSVTTCGTRRWIAGARAVDTGLTQPAYLVAATTIERIRPHVGAHAVTRGKRWRRARTGPLDARLDPRARLRTIAAMGGVRFHVDAAAATGLQTSIAGSSGGAARRAGRHGDTPRGSARPPKARTTCPPSPRRAAFARAAALERIRGPIAAAATDGDPNRDREQARGDEKRRRKVLHG